MITRTLTNERGNKIVVEARPDGPHILFRVEGPSSTLESWVTPNEAETLSEVLNAAVEQFAREGEAEAMKPECPLCGRTDTHSHQVP